MSDRKMSRSNSIQTELLGEWNLLHSENFDKFLEKLGVETVHRQISILQSATLTIALEDNIWTIFTEGAFTIHRTIFEIGTEKEERTSDGRLVTSKWSIEKDKKLRWHEKNQATGVEMYCELYVKNDQLIQKMKCCGVKARRTYAKSRICALRRLSSVF